MDTDTLYYYLAAILRYFHILMGIIWIGLLYFFNFVNIPFQGAIEAGLKPQVNPQLLGRALWWFRWGAMWTFLLGLAIFVLKYMLMGLIVDTDGNISDRAIWIMFGMTLGMIMWFNVWFIIWPAQKKILGGLKSGTPHPEAAALAKRAGLASKTNTFLSAPMLLGMIAPANIGKFDGVTFVVGIIVALLTIKMFYKLSTKVGQEFLK